jgi:hypothetical protein
MNSHLQAFLSGLPGETSAAALALLLLLCTLAALAAAAHQAIRRQLRSLVAQLVPGDFWMRRARQRHSRARLLLGSAGKEA